MNSWLSVLPTIIVLMAALISKKIILSLVLGIISAALISTNFSIFNSIKIIFDHFMAQITDIDILLFLGVIFVLGFTISLIIKTGGAQALGNIIIKRSKNQKSVETGSLLISLSLFIDDYLSSLTVGHVMRNLTDRFKIPRVKLAYLIAVMASPLVILIPISSWIGMIIGQLDAVGISLEQKPSILIQTDPYFVYLKSIPFIFYPIFILISTLFIVKFGISFGPMYKQEKIAQETGNLFGGKDPIVVNLESSNAGKESVWDLALPIFVLILGILMGMAYTGGYYLFGGKHTFIESFQHANSAFVLFVANLIAFVTGFIFAFVRKKVNLTDLKNISYSAFDMMFMSVVMIFLAWVFGMFLKQDLKTGNYLASLILGIVSINFLPLMIFFTSFFIALAIGSSWGTISIMMPLTIPMLISLLNLKTPTTIENVLMIFPCLGGLFSGAIAGNHLSPISDVTIMASSSAGAYVTDLISIRFYYIIPTILATAISFITFGFLIQYGFVISLVISMLLGILLSCLLLLIFQKVYFKFINSKN